MSGVISIDIVAFEHILAALGQVTVTQGGQTVIVTPGNFRNVVYQIRDSGEGDLAHKKFLAATFRQIFSDWQSTSNDPSKSAAILGALVQSLREKHIMLYFDDDQMNTALDLLGWSGRQADAVGEDYLMVVDANLGNKSNSSITRQTNYDVSINADGSVASQLTVAYDYPDSVASKDPAVNAPRNGPLTYSNLLQVYTPVNSTLVSSKGNFVNLRAFSYQANSLFTSIVSVPYNGAETFQMNYTAPDVIQTISGYQRYRLLIQKQPGMQTELVNVQLSLPPNATLVSSSPDADATYNIERQILEYRLALISDTTIDVVYQIK